VRRYGPLAVLLIVVPLLAFGPAERTAPTHWALVVGISDYTHFDDVEGGDLPGAENDARDVRDVLLDRWGFPEENVRLLLNQEATRDAMEEGIVDWLGVNATFQYTGNFTDFSYDIAAGPMTTIVDPASFNKVEVWGGVRVFY